MPWLNLPAWKVEDRGFEPHSGLRVSKKQNVSSPLTRNDSILWRASVTERCRVRHQTARARILKSVSGGQCHLIYSLYVHKGGLKPHSFDFILSILSSIRVSLQILIKTQDKYIIFNKWLEERGAVNIQWYAPKQRNIGVAIQITRADTNLVLINVKTVLPTLLRVDLYPKVIGQRVPSGIWEN